MLLDISCMVVNYGHVAGADTDVCFWFFLMSSSLMLFFNLL